MGATLRNWLRRLSPLKRKASASAVRNPAGRASSHSVQDVKSHYDTLTPTYCSIYGDVIQATRPSNVQDLLTHELETAGVQDGMRILDAGCGVCGPAIWFARRRDVFVEAITISGVQADLAGKAIAEAGLERKIHVQQGDYHEIDNLFPGESFDRVLFLESLCHAEDYGRVLAGARKVLKPDGRLYVKDYVTPDYRDDPEKQRRSEEALGIMGREYSVAFPRRADLLRVLEDLSFRIELVRATPGEDDPRAWNAFEDVVGFQWRKSASVRVAESIEIVASRLSA